MHDQCKSSHESESMYNCFQIRLQFHSVLWNCNIARLQYPTLWNNSDTFDHTWRIVLFYECFVNEGKCLAVYYILELQSIFLSEVLS